MADPYPVDHLEQLRWQMSHLGPKIERVTEDYADERIREKVERVQGDKQRAGLWSVNTRLREHGVPPEVRLHLVTAVANLGRIAETTLNERRERHEPYGVGGP